MAPATCFIKLGVQWRAPIQKQFGHRVAIMGCAVKGCATILQRATQSIVRRGSEVSTTAHHSTQSVFSVTIDATSFPRHVAPTPRANFRDESATSFPTTHGVLCVYFRAHIKHLVGDVCVAFNRSFMEGRPTILQARNYRGEKGGEGDGVGWGRDTMDELHTGKGLHMRARGPRRTHQTEAER